MKEQLADKHFERRAALDIGSGQTKITIADVDTINNKIVCIHHQVVKFVFLRKDLAMSSQGVLSKNIQTDLIETLKEMQQASVAFNPIKWIATGTSVFRQARNTEEFLAETEKATGIKIQVITQTEEAEIGFYSALGVSCEERENIISLDIGSGSFQMSCWINGKLHMYGSEIGSQASFDALFSLRQQAFSIHHEVHPISHVEVLDIVKIIRSKLPKPPKWLIDNTRKIIAIGNGNIFPIAWQNKEMLEFTSNDLMQACLEVIEKQREDIWQFKDPGSAVILLIYYALMAHCGMDKIHYHVTNGGCEGLLTQERYWLHTNS